MLCRTRRLRDDPLWTGLAKLRDYAVHIYDQSLADYV